LVSRICTLAPKMPFRYPASPPVSPRSRQ